jgi:hypothetical protein
MMAEQLSELIVPYDPEEKVLYKEGDERSIFRGAYPRELWRGIYRSGRFPEIVVRASFLALGFRVLISDPKMPNEQGFILTHYAGKRQQPHRAFTRMFDHFPRGRIEELNRQCDAVKIDVGGNRGGGDPDLFVFSPGGDRFFVEVKDKDTLKPKQRATFLKIREILDCEVRIARIKPVPGARPGDGLRLQLAS